MNPTDMGNLNEKTPERLSRASIDPLGRKVAGINPSGWWKLKLQWNEPVVSRSPEDTWELAGALIDQLPGRAVIAMHGELGAGKTCFVQGLGIALGVDQPVTSPTFTIVNEYRGTRPLYHIDLYRLSGPDEVLALGFDEYLNADGITVIEWAERAAELLPPDTIHIELTVLPSPDSRRIVLRQDGTENGT